MASMALRQPNSPISHAQAGNDSVLANPATSVRAVIASR